jgi:hypothetical protein
MEISDGVFLHSRNAQSRSEKPGSENVKPGRVIFSLANLSKEEAQQCTRLFAAIRLDYVAAGPDPACLEGNGTVIDDRPLFELFKRRYTYIFGPTAPKIDSVLLGAVRPHVTF